MVQHTFRIHRDVCAALHTSSNTAAILACRDLLYLPEEFRLTRIKEVLSGIRDGSTIDTLARELDMNRFTLLAMVEFLVDTGYLEIVEMRSTCSGCFGSNCSLENACNSELKVYALTSKGERFISIL